MALSFRDIHDAVSIDIQPGEADEGLPAPDSLGWKNMAGWTFTFWLNADPTLPRPDLMTIAGWTADDNGEAGVEWQLDAAQMLSIVVDGKLHPQVSLPGLPARGWIYLATVCSWSSLTTYVNDRRVRTVALDPTPSRQPPLTVTFGASRNRHAPLRGWLSRVTLWKRTLDLLEVVAAKNLGTAPLPGVAVGGHHYERDPDEYPGLMSAWPLHRAEDSRIVDIAWHPGNSDAPSVKDSRWNEPEPPLPPPYKPPPFLKPE